LLVAARPKPPLTFIARGVSTPSSLAVSTAARFGPLLCGFARGEAFNVYAGAERLAAQA